MIAPATERMGEEEFERLKFCQDGFWPAYEEARRARDAEARLERITEDAPHGALCKRGLKNLYDPGGKCTCWKRTL